MAIKFNTLVFAVAGFYLTLNFVHAGEIQTFTSPKNCKNNEFYNTVSLACENCPENSNSING